MELATRSYSLLLRDGWKSRFKYSTSASFPVLCLFHITHSPNSTLNNASS
jgi:hypothetical protein